MLGTSIINLEVIARFSTTFHTLIFKNELYTTKTKFILQEQKLLMLQNEVGDLSSKLLDKVQNT